MAQQTQNYYLGIDLGTTNSVISWGNISRRQQVLDPQVIEFPMMIEGSRDEKMGHYYLLMSIFQRTVLSSVNMRKH